jgi:hypothetical protein
VEFLENYLTEYRNESSHHFANEKENGKMRKEEEVGRLTSLWTFGDGRLMYPCTPFEVCPVGRPASMMMKRC